MTVPTQNKEKDISRETSRRNKNEQVESGV